METSETSVGRGFVASGRMANRMLSIVVPAFNEAARIGDSIKDRSVYPAIAASSN
jgi:hypothetical protein